MGAEVHSETENRFDVYRTITEKIIAALEEGAGPFVMPWHNPGKRLSRPKNAATGSAYRGVNIVALWVEGAFKSYASNLWATYRQWQKLGAQVRKGEHGAVIVFYKEIELENGSDDGGDGDSNRPRLIAKASRVFNSEQVEGWQPPKPEILSEFEIKDNVEAFVQATRADIRHGGYIACYRPSGDYIQMPEPNFFINGPSRTATEAYYSVLCHELVHLSGAPHRLNRQFGERFGDAAYAAEELVAELGAAFLCADLQITNGLRADHAAYLQQWIELLQNDRKAIFVAASKASQAADYLHGLAKGSI
jgi:antirestriction protein ArdC